MVEEKSAEAPSFSTDRVAVVVNGNAKQVNDELVEVLDQIIQSGDLFVSRSLEEGHDIAKRIVARGYPTVLTGGGDGTFVQMVTWVCDEAKKAGVEAPRFGLLRLGTGNALAWVVGAQSNRSGVVTDLARLRKEGGERNLRLLNVEDTLTPFAGIGGDAIALHHFKEMKERFEKIPILRKVGTGGLAHFAAIVGKSMPELLFHGHEKVTITNTGSDAHIMHDNGRPGPAVKTGEVIYQGDARMVAMSTIPYWGFGARMFPYADDREDRFNLRIVDIGSIDVALNIRKIWKGTYRHPKVIDVLADSLEVSYNRPIPVQIGGDPVGERATISVRLAESPIKVVDYYAPPRVD